MHVFRLMCRDVGLCALRRKYAHLFSPQMQVLLEVQHSDKARLTHYKLWITQVQQVAQAPLPGPSSVWGGPPGLLGRGCQEGGLGGQAANPRAEGKRGCP